MTDTILVAYATASGFTGEVAQTVAQTLQAAGRAAEARPAKSVSALDGYGAVVLGSGVRAGHVYDDALKFLDRHTAALAGLPLALFVVCLTMREDTPENRSQVEAYAQQLRDQVPAVQPVSIGLFAGGLDYKKLPLPLKLIMKAMKAQEGDYRNWEAIRAWAAALPAALAAGPGE